MEKRRGRPARSTAEDWERAAIAAIAAGGLAAVNVEALAATLNTTKGSFYGYFPSRDALIGAALDRWEHEHTEVMADALEKVVDPMERLRLVVPGALADETGSAVALNLLADAADPLVAERIRRITERRIRVLADCFAALGLSPADADHRALTAYGLYLGTAALRRGTPETAARLSLDYIDTVLDLLSGPRTAGDSSTS